MSDATYRADTASRPLENDETHRLISSAKVDGTYCYNSNGDQLGTVDHLMIDKISGKVEYVVLSSGGFLGLGDKLFAIPWSALTLDTEGKRFVLDVSKDRLKNAPGFDKDHWPSMADTTWGGEVHRYYGVRPYWEL